MIFIRVNYIEGPPVKYRQVELDINKKKHKFKSGDFVKDWFQCMMTVLKSNFEEPIHYSSSVDHFIMDVKIYKSAFLTVKRGKAVISYEYLEGKESVEFFVKEDESPTWKELKAYCDENIQKRN